MLGECIFTKAEVENNLQEGSDRAVGWNVRAHATHFTISITEEITGLGGFGRADRADGIEESVQNGGAERKIVACERSLGIGINALQ